MDSLRLRAFVVLGVCGVGLTGCATPCLDDGLGQSDCPTADTEGDTDEGSSSASDSNSMSASNSMTASDSMSASNSMSASDSADSTDATATDSETDSATATDSETDTDSDTDTDSASSDGGGTEWCVDADGDGFGDPDDCTNTDDPPDGTVDNDDDCDDDDDQTFPGAAENEPDGGDEACMQDADGDGWGDADPDGEGTVSGADCYDGNVALNPDTMALSTFIGTFNGAYIVEVSEVDGALSESIPIDPNTFNWDPVSATIAEDGTMIVNNNDGDRLWVVDWAGYCAGDTVEAEAEPLPMGNGLDVFCGVSFGPDGVLYGVESETDTIAMMDPSTGAVISSVAVTLDGSPYDVGSCGMTFDCHTQQMVFAAGFEGALYALDPVTGALELLVDIDGTWTPTGLGYDPIDRVVHLAANTELYRVALDGSAIDDLGAFGFGFGAVSVSNLDEMPVCSP